MFRQEELYPLRNLPSPVAFIIWVVLGYGTFRIQSSLEKVGHWRKQLLRFNPALWSNLSASWLTKM